MNNTIPSTPEPDLSASALETDLFWEKNKTTILTGLASVVIVVLGVSAWFAYDSSSNAAARRMLALANSPESLQQLVSTHPRSNPSAAALMLLAADRREAGDIEGSTKAFSEFLGKFPGHQLAGGALLGIGQNQEASGDVTSATTTYQQVLTQYPASYAAPIASYAEAEILLRDFQREEAVKRYNMIVSQFPGSPAGAMAMQQLRRLGAAPTP
jgi:TolA-binding protein